MLLDVVLASHAERGPVQADVAAVVQALAQAAVSVRAVISDGPLGEVYSDKHKDRNAAGDIQHALDVHADELLLAAMRKAPVAFYATEELEHSVRLHPDARVAVATDPLDGSSNIHTNVSIGTIFSILPVVADSAGEADPRATLLQPGANQLAAGFFIYGPQLALALTCGEGVQLFIYSARREAFVLVKDSVEIAREACEIAINASNYRHWDEPVRRYIDECFKGSGGPHDKNYNMRWIAALVADCYRILIRGGVFLYPADARQGYEKGRLRLVYEANPIAMLIEQAGGSATDGETRILDLHADSLHERTPLFFGAADEVARIDSYFADAAAMA